MLSTFTPCPELGTWQLIHLTFTMQRFAMWIMDGKRGGNAVVLGKCRMVSSGKHPNFAQATRQVWRGLLVACTIWFLQHWKSGKSQITDKNMFNLIRGCCKNCRRNLGVRGQPLGEKTWISSSRVVQWSSIFKTCAPFIVFKCLNQHNKCRQFTALQTENWAEKWFLRSHLAPSAQWFGAL